MFDEKQKNGAYTVRDLRSRLLACVTTSEFTKRVFFE